GGHLTAQPHRLQRNGPATSKRIQHARRAAAIGLADFLPEPLQIRARLPPPAQHTAFGLPRLDLLDPAIGHLLLFGGLLQHTAQAPEQVVALFLVTRVGQQRGDQSRTAGSERSARGPDVQRGDMAMAHILLMHRVNGGLLERESDLDQAFVVHYSSIFNAVSKSSRSFATRRNLISPWVSLPRPVK